MLIKCVAKKRQDSALRSWLEERLEENLENDDFR